MSTLAAKVTRALERQNIPVVGVSIGQPADRATWRAHYKQNATDAQKTAGDALIASYDEATDTDAATEDADSQIDNNKLAKAIVIWTAQRLNIPLATARNQVLTIYRGL